jgi:hypothetical protein
LLSLDILEADHENGRVKIGNTIGFVEAELEDAAGGLIARATSSVRIAAMHKAVAWPYAK